MKENQLIEIGHKLQSLQQRFDNSVIEHRDKVYTLKFTVKQCQRSQKEAELRYYCEKNSSTVKLPNRVAPKNALLYGSATIYGYVTLYGCATIYGYVTLYGNSSHIWMRFHVRSSLVCPTVLC